MKGTEDELQFGDMIEIDMKGEMKNGKVKHKHLECKFVPELADLLIENGVIEVKDIEGDENEDYTELEEVLDELIEANAELTERIEEIENKLNKILKKNA